MLGKVTINFIYVLFLIIMPNLLVSEHFKTSAYKAKNDFLVNTMIDVAEKKLKGDSTKIVDTSMRERIRATQKKLNKVGLSVGPEDGIWGPKTETALVKYLDIRGIDFDGKLDSNELKILNIPTTKEKKRRSVFYFGFGLYGNEPWSTNDAKGVGKALERFYPNRNVIKFIFSEKEKNNLPTTFPSLVSKNKIINFIRRVIRYQDLLVIGFYSHGRSKNIIGKFGNSKLKNDDKHTYGITPEWVHREFIKPFQHENVAIIISSCYSGPFGEELKSPYNIVATAAADTPSFGCSPKSTGTVYGDALQKTLNKNRYQVNFNLTDVFKDTQKLIHKLEISRGEKKPSKPQIFEGKLFSD